MSQGHINLEDDSSRDVGASARRAAEATDEERLATTRLPPHAPLPASSLPRTSWWRALIASSLAPPPHLDERVLWRRASGVCLAFGLLLIVLALSVGLKAEVPQAAPMVGVAIVSARALVALGLLALSHTVLRIGERLWKGSSGNAKAKAGPPSLR